MVPPIESQTTAFSPYGPAGRCHNQTTEEFSPYLQWHRPAEARHKTRIRRSQAIILICVSAKFGASNTGDLKRNTSAFLRTSPETRLPQHRTVTWHGASGHLLPWGFSR